MGKQNGFHSIADPSHPSAGRIYDYLLGGHHNFEVDRQAAENALKLAPFLSKTLRLIRWFLGESTRRLIDEGFDKFVDFASGLPVVDHIHELAPQGTKVVYSDIDPVTVEYAKEILGDNPSVRYMICDSAKPEELLSSEVVEDLFGQSRKVAVGFNGIAYFLSDDQVEHALKVIYNWVGEGSKLFLCDADADPESITDQIKLLFDLYDKIGQPIYVRPKEKLIEMAKPWTIDSPGVLPLDEWIDLGKVYTDEEKAVYGGQGFYGVILKK
ncbi:MAG: SAM-dependent methyltransferase [Deltaproteobacteria bacterium]|nr:SAM-dependent methyltransferase [Deltaproteobacteria bacterium]